MKPPAKKAVQFYGPLAHRRTQCMCPLSLNRRNYVSDLCLPAGDTPDKALNCSVRSQKRCNGNLSELTDLSNVWNVHFARFLVRWNQSCLKVQMHLSMLAYHFSMGIQDNGGVVESVVSLNDRAHQI